MLRKVLVIYASRALGLASAIGLVGAASGCGSSQPSYVSVAVYQGPPATVSTLSGQPVSVRCGSSAVLRKPTNSSDVWGFSISIAGNNMGHFAVGPEVPKQWGQFVSTGSGSQPITFGYFIDHPAPAHFTGVGGRPVVCS